MSLCCNDEGGAFSLLCYYNATLFYTAASCQETDPLLNYTRLPYFFFAFAHNMMLMIMIIYLTLLSILSSLSTQRHTHTQPIFSF